MKMIKIILPVLVILSLIPGCCCKKRKQIHVILEPTKDVLLQERDRKISVLCKKFVDLDNTTINWCLFCEKISTYVKDDPEFTKICELLDRLKTSTSAMSTCLKLRPYLKKLPKVVYDEFEKFSVSELLSLISTRMKQEIGEEN